MKNNGLKRSLLKFKSLKQVFIKILNNIYYLPHELIGS